MFAPGGDVGRDRDFQDPSVEAIARTIVTEREPALVTFLQYAIISRDPAPMIATHLRGRSARVTNAAADIAAACAAINGTGGAARGLRGAVLERTVYELVVGREPTAMREQKVRLSALGATPEVWSKPKEVVTDNDEVEVYEAKTNADDLDQDDVDELKALRAAVTARRSDCLPAVVTLEPAEYLKRALRINGIRG